MRRERDWCNGCQMYHSTLNSDVDSGWRLVWSYEGYDWKDGEGRTETYLALRDRVKHGV